MGRVGVVFEVRKVVSGFVRIMASAMGEEMKSFVAACGVYEDGYGCCGLLSWKLVEGLLLVGFELIRCDMSW